MRRRTAGAGALGAAVAVAALLLGSGAGQAAPGPSEAFGVFVTGIVDPPRPHVKSTDGTEKSESLVTLPDNPLLHVAVAEVTAGDSRAAVKLLDVDVLPGVNAGQAAAESGQPPDALSGLASVCEQEPLPDQLPPDAAALLPPQLSDELDPATLCAFFQSSTPAALSLDAVTIHCVGQKPAIQVAGLAVLGQEIPAPPDPEPNTEIPLGALGSITFNRQAVTNGMLTVQGAVIELSGKPAIILASATCGQPTQEKQKPIAPKPTPVTTNLPVTG